MSLKCDHVCKVLHTAPGTIILMLATAFRDQESFQIFFPSQYVEYCNKTQAEVEQNIVEEIHGRADILV